MFSKAEHKNQKRTLLKGSNYHPASFRDPSGSLFLDNGKLFRRVNLVYKDNYDLLIKSGLYKSLVVNDLLISHKEIRSTKNEGIYKILEPQLIPFVSYPYEWCFSQLKDAALLTLTIAKKSLVKGMILKDASAYNVQFLHGRPIFIDTLSFEKYEQGAPWVAYQQFCRHFLSPLLLASYVDFRLLELQKTYLDGIPLDLTSKLLPKNTFLNFSVLSNIHLHSRAEKGLEGKFVKRKQAFLSKNSLLAILDNLEGLVSRLELKVKQSEWQNYYQESSYTSASLKAKKNIVKAFIKEIGATQTLWDLGANTGYFSKDFLSKNTIVVNFDNDFLAIEKNYHDVRKKGLSNVLPLIMDLTNPSPGIGWMNKERESLIARTPCDVALALALVHHLAISQNLPLSLVANFFATLCRWLIIEFVPKEDSQVKRMLTNRQDVFPGYDRIHFEKAFSEFFSIRQSRRVQKTGRVVYLMKKK